MGKKKKQKKKPIEWRDLTINALIDLIIGIILIIIGKYIGSVSYTHLDVYKRQLEQWGELRRSCRELQQLPVGCRYEHWRSWGV